MFTTPPLILSLPMTHATTTAQTHIISERYQTATDASVCQYGPCERARPANRAKYCCAEHRRLARRLRRAGSFGKAQWDMCYLCLLPMGVNDWNLDHIVPRSAGGRSTIGNLAAVHVVCNQVKGHRGLDNVGSPSWFREQCARKLRRRLSKHIRKIVVVEMRAVLRKQHPKARRSRIRYLARASVDTHVPTRAEQRTKTG